MFFSLGYRVLSAPLTVIGSSLTQVFFPQATEANRDDELAGITLESFTQLVKIGMTPFILIAIVAPELFAIVFGNEWLTAGEYVRWMSIWLFLHFITTPLESVYMIVESQGKYLWIIGGFLLIRIFALVIGGLYKNALLSIQLYSIVGAVMCLINGFIIMKLAEIKIRVFAVVLIKALYSSIPFILIPIIVGAVSCNFAVVVITAVVFGLAFLIKLAITYIR